MKTNSTILLKLPSVAAGLAILWTAQLQAVVTQPEEANVDPAATVKDEITATGTVFSVEPHLLSVVIKDSPTPVRFAYTDQTPIVDEKGTPVPKELVRADLPLTVHYVMQGEKMRAQKIVVSRSMVAGDSNAKPAEKRKELAQENAEEKQGDAQQSVPQVLMGTLSNIEQTISVVPRGGSQPSSIIVNNSTRYMNEAGNPVGPQYLLSGMPITVKSYQDGSRAIAQEIIIRGLAPNSGRGTGVASNQQAGARNNGINQGGTSTGNQGNNEENQDEGGNAVGTGGVSTDLLPIQSGYPIAGQIGPGPGNSQAPSFPTNGARNPNGIVGNNNLNNGAANTGNQINPNQPNGNQATSNTPNTVRPDVAQPNVPPIGSNQTQGNNPNATGTNNNNPNNNTGNNSATNNRNNTTNPAAGNNNTGNNTGTNNRNNNTNPAAGNNNTGTNNTGTNNNNNRSSNNNQNPGQNRSNSGGGTSGNNSGGGTAGGTGGGSNSGSAGGGTSGGGSSSAGGGSSTPR